MEAVAEAVMDVQAILLENKTNVDDRNVEHTVKGQRLLESHVYVFTLFSRRA